MTNTLRQIFFAIAVSTALSQSLLSATVSVEPVRLVSLPGIPTPLTVTVTNDGRSPLTFENALKMKAEKNGKEVELHWFVNRPSAPLLAGESAGITLKPGEARAFYFDTDLHFAPAGWFYDPDLMTPGDLKLRAEIRVVAGAAVVSPQATITYRAPTGADAKVWGRMLELSGGHWTVNSWRLFGSEIASDVWKYYADSSYLPYVMTFLIAPDADKVELYRQAADASDDEYTTALLRVGEAYYLEQQARRKLRDGDFAAAVTVLDSSRKVLTTLAANAKDEKARARAQDALENAPTREEFKIIHENNLAQMKRRN